MEYCRFNISDLWLQVCNRPTGNRQQCNNGLWINSLHCFICEAKWESGSWLYNEIQENIWHGSTVGGIILLFNNKNKTTYHGKTKPVQEKQKLYNDLEALKNKRTQKKSKKKNLQSIKISNLWLADRKSARLQ